MAQRREIITVYAAGLIQGVALVTFPAASAVFTNPKDYGLSSTECSGSAPKRQVPDWWPTPARGICFPR